MILNDPKKLDYNISSSEITIDNPNFNAKPELELITTFKDTTINNTFWNIQGEAPDFLIEEPATFVLYEPELTTQNNSQWD